MDKRSCSRCGKTLTDSNGLTSVAIQLNFVATDDKESKRLLGKYPPGVYSFCAECWLDSLFSGSYGLKPWRR